MLTPEQIENLPNAMVELYAAAEEEILKDMARRINEYDFFIPAAEHQRQRLLAMGKTRQDIIKQLSKLTGRSTEELKKLMLDAGLEAIETDDELYKAAGLNPTPVLESQALKKTLNAGLRTTAGTMQNLTATTANTATKQFERTLDMAWLKVQSGAFDHQSAVRSAVKELASKGIESITYPSGHKDTIEVAVRRAVLTGVNKTCADAQLVRADEMGCDLVEVSAHGGARPEHAEWQGKIYDRSGKSKKYPDFKSSTGYGTGAGLCGWNCRHNFRPYIDGSPRTYSDELLKDYNAKKYEYNGEQLTEYEATQKQRAIERNIRRWKRERAAMEEIGEDATQAAEKVKEWQKRQRDFISQTGLRRQFAREQVANKIDNGTINSLKSLQN